MNRAHVAVRSVEHHARARRSEALARIERAAGTGLRDADVDALGAGLIRAGRLTLNFHPDRPSALGCTVAAGLLAHGRYVSQFVSGISNGSRSAVSGGERDGWEHRLFADAYADAHRDADAAWQRPVYGALDLLRDPHGGSPRFGSAYLVLHPHVAERTTFCVGDSHVGPTDLGTLAAPWCIVAGLVEQAARGELLNRRAGLDVLADVALGRWSPRPPDRRLDGYIEAQVHDGVDLRRDVSAIVLDPSFLGTDVHRTLGDVAHRFGIELDWHGGSVIDVDDVPADFRGPTMPALARQVASMDGRIGRRIDAAAIGRAAALVALDPPSPDGDPPESDLQQLKYLWHVLLALGRDAR